MNFIVQSLKDPAEIAVFLVLAIDAWVGKFKVGSFNLGAVMARGRGSWTGASIVDRSGEVRPIAKVL